MKKILAIQHDAADPPAAAGDVVTKMGHHLEVVRLDRGDQIPTTADADVLMTFGGGISFARGNSPGFDLPEWVAQEQSLVREYVHTGRKVLGICLGSQLVASALGAEVRRNDEPEVGWHNVYPTESANEAGAFADIFAQPSKVFHWHQDTFAIPKEAVHCLSSDACDHQAYVMDGRVFGLQFHLEANEKTVATFLAVSRLWRQDARFVQTEQEISQGVARYLEAQTTRLEKLMQVITAE